MDPTLIGLILAIVAIFIVIRLFKESFLGRLLHNILSLAFLGLIIYIVLRLYNFLAG